MPGISAAANTVTASLLRAADDNTGVAASLLKKALNADKDVVNTLLPAAPHGGLEIRA